MNTLLLIFLAPFLTSTAVGQVESVQTQTPFLQTAALKFYCRYGSVLNEDVSGCTPKTVVQEQPQQTVQEKVVEVVRNVFVPVASAQEPSDSYLESMIRRIVTELLPQPQVITVKGEKGDKGDKGDPGTSGSNLLAFDGIQMPFWSGYGAGAVTGGGSTVVNNYYTATSGTSTVSSNTLTFSTTTGLLTSDVGGVMATTTIAGFGTNIYNSNGTLLGNRILDGSGNSLSFTNLALGIGGTPSAGGMLHLIQQPGYQARVTLQRTNDNDFTTYTFNDSALAERGSFFMTGGANQGMMGLAQNDFGFRAMGGEIFSW